MHHRHVRGGEDFVHGPVLGIVQLRDFDIGQFLKMGGFLSQ
jgi:hypothetical protein